MLAAGSPVSAAGAAPTGPISFRLVTPSARLLAAYAQNAWSIGPDAGLAAATCEISGDDSSVALFVMGRIGVDHPLVTTSDLNAARAFKRYFPGP